MLHSLQTETWPEHNSDPKIRGLRLEIYISELDRKKSCALKLTTTQANSPPLSSARDKTANITYSPDTEPILKTYVQYVEFRYGQQIFIFPKLSRSARGPPSMGTGVLARV